MALIKQLIQVDLFLMQNQLPVFQFFSNKVSQTLNYLLKRLENFTEDVSQALNTPVWHEMIGQNDEAVQRDQMEVSDPAAYKKSLKSCSKNF